MRRIALWAVVGTTVAWGATTALFACSSANSQAAGSSSSSSSGFDNSSGNSSSSSTSGSGTTSSSSSSSSSSSGSVDAGSDAAVATGATPGKVACPSTAVATASCTVVANTDEPTVDNPACCIPQNTNGDNIDQTKEVCATAQAPCDPDAQYSLACDDQTDCPKDGTTQQLCFFQNGQSNCADTKQDFADGEFGDDSDFGPVQLCKTNAECGTGVTCALKTCTDENGFTVKLQICGTVTGCQ